MKKYCVWFVLCLSLFLIGCHKKVNEPVTGTKIYYVNKDETAIVSEPYDLQSTDRNGQIEEFLKALSIEPQNSDYKLAKPKDITLLGYNFGDAGQLLLGFDINYKNVTGISEVLMRAAIVKTFTQIEGITYVEFLVNGRPLTLDNENWVGMMRADHFIDNVGDFTSYSQVEQVSLFFANETGDGLLESVRRIEYNGSIPIEQVIVEQLIAGPLEVELQSGMRRTIPENTVLNKISKKDGICTVDLSSEFLNKLPKTTEAVTIYSIVNTLISEENIDRVQFLINGEVTNLYRKIAIDQPLERNLDIIKSEK